MSLATASIIIPTYNREHTIARAVESAFAQIDVQVEVIVVDDGSSDGTAARLDALQNQYGPALKRISQENAGASAARNRGLAAATGEFVQFLDSDDSLYPNKLAKQIAQLSIHLAAEVSLCYGWLQTPTGEEIIGRFLGASPDAYIEAMCGRGVHVIQTSSPVWRRSFLADGRLWNPEISLGDDLEFHTRCLADVTQIAFTECPLFTIHQHDGDRLSDFSSNENRLRSLITTREVIYDGLVERNAWTDACQREMSSAFRAYYPVFLMKSSNAQLSEFERIASRVAGESWRDTQSRSLALVRRWTGRAGTNLSAQLLMRARAIVNRLKSADRSRLHRMFSDVAAGIDPRSRRLQRQAFDLLDRRAANRKSALFVELNAFHGETMPGFVSLLSSAGFECTVLHRSELDIDDVFCRLPDPKQPVTVPLPLSGIRAFMKSDLVKKFDLVMLGSTVIASKGVRYQSVTEYLGGRPQEFDDFYSIEHSAITRQVMSHRSNGHERTFSLRDMTVETGTLPMLAPVDFGETVVPGLAEPVIFTVIGRLDPKVRNADALYSAVRQLATQSGPRFEIHLIGGAQLQDVPEDIRSWFRSLGRLSFPAMYKAIEESHYLLPLLDSRVPSHCRYLTKNTTGSRQLAFGFSKVMVMDAHFAEAYAFDQSSAVIHAPGDLLHGLKEAIHAEPKAYEYQCLALAEMKSQIFETSLQNLQERLPKHQSSK